MKVTSLAHMQRPHKSKWSEESHSDSVEWKKTQHGELRDAVESLMVSLESVEAGKSKQTFVNSMHR